MTQTHENAKEFFKLYKQLESLTDTSELSPDKLISVTISLMQYVDKYKNLSGPQKKSLVCNVLKQFIEDKVTNDDAKTILLVVINTTLPTVIDSVISIDKKQLKIKATKILRECC